MHQLVTGITIHAKKVVVAEIEENQLKAISPVVETHIYVIAVAIRKQLMREIIGRPLLSTLPKIAGNMPIFDIAVWIREAMKIDSDPMQQRQMSKTTLIMSGKTLIPEYPIAMKNGEAATLLVLSSRGSL